MTVYNLRDVALELGVDALLWDAIECEWRIGHAREIDGQVEYVDGSMDDADARESLDCPLALFAEVTHWAALPDAP